MLPSLKEEGGGGLVLDEKKSSSSSSSSVHRFIVFSPVLRSLQQLLPYHSNSNSNSNSNKLFPASLAVEFCRDIMSAVNHCSKHGVFFKWISLDHIYISSSSCQLIIGSFSGVGGDGNDNSSGKEGSKDNKRKGSSNSNSNDNEKHEKKRQKDHKDKDHHHHHHKKEKEKEKEKEEEGGDDGNDGNDDSSFHISTPLYESSSNKHSHSHKGHSTSSSSLSLYTSETISHCVTTTSPEVIFGGSPDAASNTWIACSICVHICTGKPIVKAGKTDEKYVQHLYKVLGTPKALKYKSFERLPAASVYGRSIIGKNGEPEESRSRIFKHLDTIFPDHLLRELSFSNSSGNSNGNSNESDGGGIKDMLKGGLHLVPDNRPLIDTLLSMRLFTQRPVLSIHSKRDILKRMDII